MLNLDEKFQNIRDKAEDDYDQILEKIDEQEFVAYAKERINAAYKTLKRVPDDIILAAMVEDMNMDDANTCLIGTVVREKISMIAGIEFDPCRDDPALIDAASEKAEFKIIDGDQYRLDTVEYAVALFGGVSEEWENIFDGVTHDDEDEVGNPNRELNVHEVEIALMRRLDLAINRA